jgi:hypothetical protein
VAMLWPFESSIESIANASMKKSPNVSGPQSRTFVFDWPRPSKPQHDTGTAMGAGVDCQASGRKSGAGDETRTRDPLLGKIRFRDSYLVEH